VLSTYLEKGGRSERDKLDRRRSTKLTILPSSDSRPLQFIACDRHSSSSVYSTIPSHGSISDSRYLQSITSVVSTLNFKLFEFNFCVCVDCNHISSGTESQGHRGQPSRAGVDVRISKDSNDTTRHDMLF